MLLEHPQRRHPAIGKQEQLVGRQQRAPARRQQLRALEQVLDLATVERERREPVDVGVGHLHHGRGGASSRLGGGHCRRPREEVPPHLGTRWRFEGFVGQQQVDARLEGVVDAGEAVGGEEEDALVVFEFGEEDWRTKRRPG